jgi:Kef-type K+ transport system membrane component KefB
VLFTRNVVGDPSYRKLVEQTEVLTMGFLAPVFFASIGMHLSVGAIIGAPVFLLILLDHPDPTPPAVEYLFSSVVIMAIVTTLASPFALRWLLPGNSRD